MMDLRRLVAVAAVPAVALAVAACGSSSSSSSTAGAAAGGTTQSVASSGGAGGSCGTIPTKMPADPDGVLAKLPASVQAAYNLYTEPVYASAWANWKPAHPGPYTVAVSAGELSDPFAVDFVKQLKLRQTQTKDVKRVLLQSANLDAQTQIRQLQQDIRDKVDIMVVFAMSPAADAAVLKQAGEAGIPVIAPLNPASSRYTIGLNGNEWINGAYLTQGLVKVIGGKGNLLKVQGLAGDAATDAVLDGADAVLKDCPGVKVVGSPVGGYNAATAKTQTLQFLAAHPQPVDAAIQVGGMATGIIQGFQQTGRKVPTIADLGATPGALAYWTQNKGTYKGVALAAPTLQEADATWTIALGLLQGRGVKISQISQKPLLITDANLAQWVKPDWTINTPQAYAEGPPGSFYSASYLDQFFTHPAK